MFGVEDDARQRTISVNVESAWQRDHVGDVVLASREVESRRRGHGTLRTRAGRCILNRGGVVEARVTERSVVRHVEGSTEKAR